MTEIGATLREARMRRKIDITVVEEHTKIRAKYLRALENEEWSLLPGPTFARSFLRTYAEFLGLDAQLLVDELRHQASAPEAELFHYTEPPLHEHMPGQHHGGPRIGRGLVIGALILGLLGFLLVLGLTGGAGERKGAGTAPSVARTQTSATTEGQRRPRTRTQKPSAPATGRRAGKVRAQITAAGDVWVCLVDDRGRRLIDAEVIPAGRSRGPFVARRLKVTFGNGEVAMRINGRAVDVPETSAGIGYEITPKRVRRLSSGSRPSCT